MQLKHQALEAFRETVEVFDDQMKLHDRFKKKAAPQDLPKYALLTRFVSELSTVLNAQMLGNTQSSIVFVLCWVIVSGLYSGLLFRLV